MAAARDQADYREDTFPERVVRNEGKLEALEAKLDAETNATRRALKLQAKEYERRLENLNGEATRIGNVQSQSVTRELFDAELRSVRDGIENLKSIIHADVEAARQINAQRIAILESEVNGLKDAQSTQTGKSLGRGELVALLFSMLGAFVGVVVLANYLTSH